MIIDCDLHQDSNALFYIISSKKIIKIQYVIPIKKSNMGFQKYI